MSIMLCPGASYEVHCMVNETNTALRMGSGDLPVYATPAMAALMESAAVSALPDLPEGTTTVGTQLSIRHMAATPIGMTVRAMANLVATDGKKLTFEVQAFDEKEKIGEGMHERCIVQTERFLAKVNTKNQAGNKS